ncbi:MAG TPA: tubulin-like doman-containing protein, partial [Gemmataceae bacterium]|nr:tubulin-like doman-containing protein [Gemmataceae bacterium]
HLDQLLPHLSELVTAVNNSEARAATERTTGVTVRGDSPQVFVVASSAGGTGSGGVVDLAYAVRRVLQGLNLPHARVCGILIHATNQNPAEADLARLNTFVTLHELGHYNRSPSTYLGAAPQGRRAAGPNIPPFDDCYVVHLGDQLSSADIQNCVNEVAEYLYANMATPVGAFLERWRRASAKANPKDEDAQGLRSFGLHRYGFPKNRLAKLAAGRFCRDFIERWLGEHLDCSEDSMRADICARMASLGLEPQAIEKLFCAAALRVLGDDAEKYFLEKIARLPPVPPGEDVRKRFSADIISGVLTRIDAFFAMTPDDPLRAANAVTPLESALAELCRELTGNLGRPTLQWLISKLDNPQRRLRGAYHAANVVRQQINAGAASVTHQLEQVRAHQITVRDALMAGNAKKVESDLVWLGGRPACQGADKSVQQFAEYFLFRLKERTLRRTQQVLDALAARLAEWNTELEAINLKLRTFAETFLPPDSTLDAPASALRRCPAQTELLPPGAQSLLDAAGQIAARVTPEAVAEFDQLFQEEIVNSYGGLWGFTCSMEENEDRLREALLQRASEALLPALAEFDAAQLLLESWTDAQRGKQEIKDRAAATAPRLDLPGAQRQLIIGLPKSTAGTALHEILDPASFTVPSTLLDTDGDILFCAESAALPIDQTAEFLVHDPERYREVVAQVTTRKDVPWSFLELSETNP